MELNNVRRVSGAGLCLIVAVIGFNVWGSDAPPSGLAGLEWRIAKTGRHTQTEPFGMALRAGAGKVWRVNKGAKTDAAAGSSVRRASGRLEVAIPEAMREVLANAGDPTSGGSDGTAKSDVTSEGVKSDSPGGGGAIGELSSVQIAWHRDRGRVWGEAFDSAGAMIATFEGAISTENVLTGSFTARNDDEGVWTWTIDAQ